jgi:hypothetical protein
MRRSFLALFSLPIQFSNSPLLFSQHTRAMLIITPGSTAGSPAIKPGRYARDDESPCERSKNEKKFFINFLSVCGSKTPLHFPLGLPLDH